MKKKKVIYIHGNLGAGKTSTADGLAERLHYKRMSAGKFFRDEAVKRGMTFEEFHDKVLKVDNSVDKKIDNIQKRFIDENEGLVMDGRLGFYLSPLGYNVFLDLPVVAAVDRVMQDMKSNPDRQVEKSETREEMMQKLEHRKEMNRLVLRNLYGIQDCFDRKHFDLIVDTEANNLKQVIDIIYNNYIEWLDGEDPEVIE